MHHVEGANLLSELSDRLLYHMLGIFDRLLRSSVDCNNIVLKHLTPLSHLASVLK